MLGRVAVSAFCVSLLACTLEGDKNACERDEHCTGGRVCRANLCVDPAAIPAPPAAPVEAAVTPAPNGVYALTSTDPGSPFDELEPFLSRVGERQVVGFGDTFFTSGGMNDVKARAIRALVEKRGFRVIALTSAWREAESAAEYLASCKGDATAALDHLDDIYQDVSMRNLLAWLCTWNGDHQDDPVTLFGFDIVQPWIDVEELTEFGQTAPGIKPGLADRLRQCSSGSFQTKQDFLGSAELQKTLAGETPMQQSRYDACMQELTTISVALDATPGDLRARASLQSFKAWESYVYLRSNGAQAAAFEAWEQGNFALFDLFRTNVTGAAKTIVLGHLVSVARATGDLPAYKGSKSLGFALQRRFGSSYLPVLVLAYDVSTRLEGLEHPAKPTAAYSLERRLDERAYDMDVPGLFVDLEDDALDRELIGAGQLYEVGGGLALDPFRQFSALLFLTHSAAMTFAR